MIEACFDERSMTPYCQNDDEVDKRLELFADLIGELQNLHIKVRYENAFSDIKLKEDFSLYEYCVSAKSSVERNRAQLFYSNFRRPYLDEDKENLFYNYEECKLLQGEKEYDCYGIYIAFLTDSFVVGFDPSPFEKWAKHSLGCKLRLSQILNKNSNDTQKKKLLIREESVLSLTRKEDMSDDAFVELISSQTDLEVPKYSGVKSQINLPDHHGKKECMAFAKRIQECEYVAAVLNSIDFDPREKCFIHKIKGPNLLEVRIPNTKFGYGLCISTTAENEIQNHWIAKFLERKYGA